MKDLRDAIKRVLYSCVVDDDGRIYITDCDTLYELQAEYNIHFVEPEDKQLDVF